MYISTFCEAPLVVQVSVGVPPRNVAWVVESSSVSADTSWPVAARSVPTPGVVASS